MGHQIGRGGATGGFLVRVVCMMAIRKPDIWPQPNLAVAHVSLNVTYYGDTYGVGRNYQHAKEH